jgi:hypothetical protein
LERNKNKKNKESTTIGERKKNKKRRKNKRMKKNRIIQQKKKEQEKIGNQEKERKYKVYKTRRRRIDKDNKEK